MGHLKNIHKAAFRELTDDGSTKITDSLPSTSFKSIKELTKEADRSDALKEPENKTVGPPKRQKTIQASFEGIYAFSANGDKTIKINNALVYMVCKDNQPFTIVENEGFRNLLKVIEPRYKLPHKTTLTRWVDDKYAALSGIIREKLSGIENLTLTTDMWSESMSMRSFLGVTAHFLVLAVPTRWNSTYYMIERFIELREIVNNIIIRHKNAPAMLHASELAHLSSVLQVLRPIEAATKEVSATVLDPRFKKMHFTDPLACSAAVGKIKDLMKAAAHNTTKDSESSELSDKNENNYSLWEDHHKLVHKSWKLSKADDTISDELAIYLRCPVGRLTENPLEIWKDLEIQLPQLKPIAYKYLTMVGTSVPSERLFSKSGPNRNSAEK
ncbi:zinc finger BED domain-containing protein 4-like [Bactrocera tryoni]|uniref:zinc finger BED domain-containing protein 4-like n=1 Tax=Bactrocera tryoni TaxID=59916 RepID=UPI001A96D366|nr:zinc finger BED domain-containing protein 4-like [Bactrocera tryoni]